MDVGSRWKIPFSPLPFRKGLPASQELSASFWHIFSLFSFLPSLWLQNNIQQTRKIKFTPYKLTVCNIQKWYFVFVMRNIQRHSSQLEFHQVLHFQPRDVPNLYHPNIIWGPVLFLGKTWCVITANFNWEDNQILLVFGELVLSDSWVEDGWEAEKKMVWEPELLLLKTCPSLLQSLYSKIFNGALDTIYLDFTSVVQKEWIGSTNYFYRVEEFSTANDLISSFLHMENKKIKAR